MSFFIFFFQAEDGIRDVAVTGVQTCALPISKLATPEMIRNARKKYPTLDWVNECTLEITPERVMNVPKIDNSHDPMIRARFHFFNIPRFSWIITEWRNAVIVSHGRSDAFSTGSHAQYPPHPSST